MELRKKHRGWRGMLFLALALALWLGKDSGAMERILFATDMHYLSGQLTDYGPLFDHLMKTGDGKLTEKSEEILEALLGQAKKEGVSTVVLAGDLTFNGERQSLLELKERFEKEQEQGLRILVIPGNHDIAYPYACSYFGTKAKRVDAVSQRDFRELMGSFGYDGALYRDLTSFSYVTPLSEKEWLVFLDANTEASPGRISEPTLAWLGRILSGRGEGVRVTIVCHQNLLPHSSLMQAGFVLGNWQVVDELLRSEGVTLALTGHSHLQDTAEEEGFTDICTESLAVAPLRYALLTLEEGKDPVYEKKDLPLFQKEARERFYLVVGEQVAKVLKGKALTDSEREQLLSFAQEVNLAYFSGSLIPEVAERFRRGERWRLWRTKAADTFWYIYMKSYLG